MSARRALLPLVGLILPVAGIAAWWIASAAQPSFYFPALSTIWDRFVQTWILGGTAVEVVPTLTSFFLGFAAASVVGVVLGIVLALMPRVYDFLSPLLEFLRALPGIALIPLFVSALGVGFETRVALVLFGATWPILLNTLDGVRGLDLTVRDTAFSYRLPFRDRLFSVILPGASPQIFAGLRVALSISIVVVIASEMVVSVTGIGHFLLKAQAGFDLVAMWTGLILMGLLGYLLNVAFDLVERRVLRWHRRMNEGSTR